MATSGEPRSRLGMISSCTAAHVVHKCHRRGRTVARVVRLRCEGLLSRSAMGFAPIKDYELLTGPMFTVRSERPFPSQSSHEWLLSRVQLLEELSTCGYPQVATIEHEEERVRRHLPRLQGHMSSPRRRRVDCPVRQRSTRSRVGLPVGISGGRSECLKTRDRL